MPEYTVCNAYASEEISCESAGKAVDLFMALHPEQKDNAVRVTLSAGLMMAIKCDDLSCNAKGFAWCLKCGNVSCPWHLAGLGLGCVLCGGGMKTFPTPSEWHVADMPKPLREQGSPDGV